MKAKHILIVDDEPRVAFFLSRALEQIRQGYRISIAHSGEEALDALNRFPIDLLITDLRLPGIDGLELLRWARASSPQTRAILITAYGSDKVEAEARRLEVCRYITKPFNLHDFTQAVQEALRDTALNQPALIALSDASFEAVTRLLEELRRDTGARCVFLADMLGQRLVEAGVTQGVDSASVLSLLAGGFAASGALAQCFGGDKALTLNFHEGTRYEIYSANVGDHLFLAMLYDRKGKANRIGLVWLYMRRAIERLQAVLSTADSVPARSLDESFGASLMSELDVLFPDASSQGAPRPTRLQEGNAARAPQTAERPSQPFESKSEVGKDAPRHSRKEPSNGELLTLEEAIARGLVPPGLLKP